MNPFNIQRAFSDKARRGWDTLYWAIDLHDTIIPGRYNKFNTDRVLYPGVKEVFAWLNRRQDQRAILYTSSHPDAIDDIVEWLAHHDVFFDYINENPECPSTDLCDFSKKFYFNILLDDKAGFCGETDWLIIKQELMRIGEWTK